MGVEAQRRFWNERDDYHELVETLDQNIELTHPSGGITSDGQGHRFCYHCIWSETCVKYYEYTGPDITRL